MNVNVFTFNLLHQLLEDAAAAEDLILCLCLTVWDSSAKSPVGLLTGTSQQFGNFDECLEVHHPVSSQYCLISLILDVPPGHDSLDPETEHYSPIASVWDKIYVS